MSDIKWIKVAIDMFEDSKIEFMRSLPEGDSIIVIWLQLLSIAGKSNADGYLLVTEGIPYTEQILCNTLRRNPVLMQFALQTFVKLKMVNVDDGPFHITKWEKHQNTEQMGKIKSDGAIRQARYRERQREKQLLLPKSDDCDITGDVTSNVTKRYSNEQEVRSKNKEIKDSGRNRPTRTQFIIPTIEEVIEYCNARNNGVNPYKWHDHYTANDWKVGKNKMKDWRAAVRTWEGGKSSSTSTVARTGQAAYHIPTIEELKEQDKKRMEQIKAEGLDWL